MAMDTTDVLSDGDLDDDEVKISHARKLSKKRSAPTPLNQVDVDEVGGVQGWSFLKRPICQLVSVNSIPCSPPTGHRGSRSPACPFSTKGPQGHQALPKGQGWWIACGDRSSPQP